MSKQAKTAGISQRAYAEQIGVHHSYVAKMIRRGAIPVLPDGSIDPKAADEGRAKYTRVGKGQRKWQRRHPEPEAAAARPPCPCGYEFLSVDPPGKFCCDFCAQDAAEGYTPKEMRDRRENEDADENWHALFYRSPRGGPGTRKGRRSVTPITAP